MNAIEQAARREQAAERNRVEAETVWRQAWWSTTLALGTPAESDRQAVTTALDTAQRILGQSRSWLSSRRKLGRLLTGLPAGQVHALPPRLAIAFSDAHGDPLNAIQVLRDAETRGLSLRDFAQELGTQPKSWLREGEQSQRPLSVEQLRARPADEQAVLIRAALEDPAVARQVFTAPRTGPGLPPVPPEPLRDGPGPRRPVAGPTPDPGKPDVLALLGDARIMTVRAFRLSVLRSLAQDADVLAALAALEVETRYLRQYLAGHAADDAIARILAES